MNYFAQLFVITVITSSLINANCHETERIIGGIVAKQGEFKYQLSLQITKNPVCGAGIIDNDFVISGAHCITDSSNGDFIDAHFTIVASFNASDPVIRYDVEKVYIPESFKPKEITPKTLYGLPGDIAVIKIKGGLNLDENENLGKLSLPEQHVSYLRKTAVIAGYGFSAIIRQFDPVTCDYSEVKYNSGILRYAETEIISNHRCIGIMHNLVHASNLCARVFQNSTAKGVCTGDSGSILVHDNIAIGVLLAGPLSCIEDKVPGIYTRISSYLTFIENAKNNKKTVDIRSATLVRVSSSYYRFIED